MILIASQRGGAGNLARHLLNDKDNDHVTVHELRGFVADDLHGALAEAHAISKGTRCQQFMFSLSLNPPKDAQGITTQDLIQAADRAEQAVGLTDQPRAIVIHEKDGRLHAHVVWSRIDAEQMKAINLPYFKNRLNALSKELYLEHGWELPEGHKENGWKNPLNFTLAEWQQAKRLGLDPREIKQVFREAWEQSDNLASFRNALEEHGYFLARGDRRGFVAVDVNGEVFSVARQTGEKTKDVNARLGDPERLPSVEEIQKETQKRLSKQLRGFIREDRENKQEELKPLLKERELTLELQKSERTLLQWRQEQRWREETKIRAERVRTGFKGLVDKLTGKAAAIRRENEMEAYRGFVRDRDQREALHSEQRKERGDIQKRIDEVRERHRMERMRMARRIADVLRHTSEMESEPSRRRIRSHEPDLSL
jgi:hypothetical protein